MRIAPWKALLPYVLPEVDKCPKAQIINEIRRASIDFCQRSQIWQEELDQLFFLAGFATAEMDPPRETRICEVMSLRTLNNEYLTAGEHFKATTGTVFLSVTPTVDTKMIATAALKPTLTSTGLDEGIMEDWGYVIAYGAIASLKAMRGREWEDIPGAQIKNELFEEGVTSAKIRAVTGGAKRSLTVKSRSFFQ